MAKFDRVLFVRVDDELLKALDHLTEKIQKTSPHRPVSRASVVRAALLFAIRHDLELDAGRGKDDGNPD